MSTTTLTTDSLWQRSKKRIPLLGRISKPKNGANASEDQIDVAKAAHARRREQVRRAQRNHRARKENYIKVLEKEFRTLRNEEDSIVMETQKIVDENKMLREIMLANGISFPGRTPPPKTQSRPPTVVRVVGDPGSEQRLEVSVDGVSDTPRIFLPGSVQKIAPLEETVSSVPPKVNSHSTSGANYCNHTDLASSPQHPLGLDTTQVGVDFVLFLEHHCLQHARTSCAKSPFSGHVLTFQTPLIANGPEILRNNDTWEIPACHLDRLFELAAALDLDGDITPVQAWKRIKQHPSFHKLDAERLRSLSTSLRKEVQCFGFGAVIDEELFDMYLEKTFSSL
ncbi:hypothetical protein PRK78_007160 [Emydomyces testavorans]|uniref:BZIP domain-containing protein n=1 Tax=Emydomyces testavorans TaxID=2070801 RepID=A0AAF0DNK4_9EURO|nr:hypothetical protein PRK78_007160 [Emydomyces testavorans]